MFSIKIVFLIIKKFRLLKDIIIIKLKECLNYIYTLSK